VFVWSLQGWSLQENCMLVWPLQGGMFGWSPQ
jgi:hypothetical protein